MTTSKRLFAATLMLASALALAQETIRPEVGKPLQAAQSLLKAGKYKEALTKVREADAVGNQTPYENFIVERLRGSAAAGAGDEATAIKSFESVLASGRLQGSERIAMLEALAGSAYRAKDYPKALEWTQRYFKEGGSSAQMKAQSVERSVPVVDETTLRMLAASYAKLGDEKGYLNTLEKLLVSRPKKEYWADILARLPNKPGFSERLTLDVYRLKLATGTLDEPDQYMEMAQLALQASLPSEAKRVVDAGYAVGKLGTGGDAERHKRLRDLVNKQAAEDEKTLTAEVVGRSAEALVNTGQALVSAGRSDKGIELMEQGIGKGGLKRPEEARLHLGEALFGAGKKTLAVEAFNAVKGSDGASDLARLWAILAAQP